MTKGLDLPGPWVLGLDTHNHDLSVHLTLFGFSVEWAPAAVEAMTRALIELVEWPRNWKPAIQHPSIKSRSVRHEAAISDRIFERSFELAFVAPLVITGQDPLDQPSKVLTGLGARLSGLARWHDVSLDGLVDWRMLRVQAEALDYSVSEVQWTDWQRGSRRQDRRIPMRGVRFRLGVDGELGPDIAALLSIGETCHAGADTALGCGRFVIRSA